MGDPGSDEPSASGVVLVSVLVPVRNEAASIPSTVAAMQAQELDGEMELLFIDGRSEDATVPLLEQLARDDPRIQVLDNPLRHTAAALNVGLGHARGEYVARMDGHTLYPADYLALGIDRLRRDGVEWVAGPQVPQGKGPWSRRVALALSSPLGVGGSSKWGTAGSGYEAGSAAEFELDTGVFAGVWSRSTIDAHGGWAEGWPINQDSELAARVLKDGGRIVCLPAMGARYFPRDSLGGLARQYWRFGFYRAKTAWRHPESLRRSHVLAPAVALTALAGLAPLPRIAAAARVGIGVYAASLIGASAAAGRRSAPGDAFALPAVFATMHLSWGAGFLLGCLRYPPLRALARVASEALARNGGDPLPAPSTARTGDG